MPPHACPSANFGSRSLAAPKTWYEVIRPKNIHMQKSPSHVKNWTTASCFIVAGISRMAEVISAKYAPTPRCSLCLRLNSSMSSGGYSFDVKTVHSTQSRKATAPILNA